MTILRRARLNRTLGFLAGAGSLACGIYMTATSNPTMNGLTLLGVLLLGVAAVLITRSRMVLNG